MGGVTDLLFGSSDEGGLKGQAPNITPEQKKLLDLMLGTVSGGVGQGVDPYPGTAVPGPSGIQNEVFSKLTQILGTPNNTLNAAVSQLMAPPGTSPATPVDAARPLGPTATGSATVGRNAAAPPFDPVAEQDYWQKAFVDPATQRWEKDVVPNLLEKYISNDALDSGAARRAVAGSAADLSTDLNSQLANLLYSGRKTSEDRGFTAEENFIGRQLGADESGLARTFAGGESSAGRDFTAQLDALSKMFAGGESAAGRTQADTQNFLNRLLSVPGMENENMLAPLMQSLIAGGTQRDITGQQLGEDYSKWQSSQPYNNPWLQLAPMLLGTQATTPIVQGPSQTSGLFQDVVAPIMGGFLGSETGAGMAPTIFNPAKWFGG